MGQDLFTCLPSEIMLNILSRLPAPTTMKCKCVCKLWLDVLSTPEFVQSHLSKSVPCMAVFLEGENAKPYRIVEFEDEHHWNIAFNFDLPLHEPLHSSVNGLILLCRGSLFHSADLSLCNPITRDYIKIPSPRQHSTELMIQAETYGFGVSRMSCQYKVVRLFNTSPLQPLGIFQCQIYTVGSRSWRGITCDGSLRFDANTIGASLNENLHWLAGSSMQISCLDLETELFSTFSPPPLDEGCQKIRKLLVLGDSLCVCDNSWQTSSCEIDIWLMKEYGDEKSWAKQFVTRMDRVGIGFIYPIKVFKDGDILMKLRDSKLLRYSSNTKTIQPVDDVFGSETFRSIAIFTPSFLSLKTFAMENVITF